MTESYQKTFSNRIETNETSKPENPQLEIKNPLHKSIYINALDLLLDPKFSYKGDIEVYNNNSLIFSSVNSSLKNFSLFSIPLTNELLENNNKIKIFIWNSKDSLTIGLTVNSTVGETNNFLGSGSKTLDREDFNFIESSYTDLFAKRLYSDEVLEKPLDMEGYSKLTVLISASQIPKPTVLLSPFDHKNMVDNNLSSFSSMNVYGSNQTLSFVSILDFGSIAERNIAAKFEYQDTTVDNINRKHAKGYSSVVIETSIFKDKNFIFSNSNTFMRYAKVTCKVTYNLPPSKPVRGYGVGKLYEIYDSNVVGGSVELSFWLRGASGDLIEYISADKFGTLSAGGSIRKDISNIAEDVTGRIGYFLPQLE